MLIPRIVLAGTHSGVGKTTIATGLMAALKLRNRPIQAFKVGPDYIDPSHHAAATGNPSYNLDRWLLGNNLLKLFERNAQGRWAIIEGVMGMFDGMRGTKGFGSTADIAKEINAPVILIVDAKAMSRSMAALVYGFVNFDPQIQLAGVILNRVKSLGHEKMLKEALEELDLPVLGCIPQEAKLTMPERHLGLIPTGEKALDQQYLYNLADTITRYVDLDQIENIMLNAPENITSEAEFNERKNKRIRIGIAWDEAFLFYYQDALKTAEDYGFEWIPFSPIHDHVIPNDEEGLFFGGGFPELHLQELSENTAMKKSIRQFSLTGKTIYAECGGYMYLGETITDFQGNSYPLVGLIPMHSEMTSRLQGMGYSKGFFAADNFLGPKGTEVHGHEFHYSRALMKAEINPAYRLFKGDQFKETSGYVRDNIVASYLHLHFSGHPELLACWSNHAFGGQR